jgi:hypothetical protein
MVVMGFPSPSQGSPQTEPEAPVSPPVRRGFACVDPRWQKKTASEVESPEAVFSPPVSSLYAARVTSLRVATDVTNSDSQYGIPAI